jgi:hypothetical protein
MDSKHPLNGVRTPLRAPQEKLPTSPSVNKDTTRASTAPTPRTLGPREA